jgi:hypothetical protein
MAPFRTGHALALAGALMCALAIPSSVHAQSSTQKTPAADGDDGSKLPVSLERIRDGVQRDSKLKIDFLDPDVPLFRVHVHENSIELEDYWKVGPDTAVSRMVRPSHASRFHHEFLQMVTPTDYLATVPMAGNPVHPVGPPILEISKGIKKILNDRERGRIKRQIQDELKQIEANNAQSPRQP